MSNTIGKIDEYGHVVSDTEFILKSNLNRLASIFDLFLSPSWKPLVN